MFIDRSVQNFDRIVCEESSYFSSFLLLLIAWYVLFCLHGVGDCFSVIRPVMFGVDDDDDKWRRRRIYEFSRREGCCC